MQEEEQGGFDVNECIEDEQQQKYKHQHLAPPHLLAFQVGIIVAQPPPVLPHAKRHIYRQEHIEHQNVANGYGQTRLIGIENVQCRNRRVWHQGRDDGPDGTPAVLEHGEQRAGDGDHHPDAIDYGNHHIACRMDVVGIDQEKIP